jgi:hypothetical protein
VRRVAGAVDGPGGLLAAREIARAEENGEVLCRQIFCDLKADPLIGAGDQDHGLIMHCDFSI